MTGLIILGCGVVIGLPIGAWIMAAWMLGATGDETIK